MELLEIIKSRRSVRKFTPQPVLDAEINKILDAGRWAPSGLNNQPWRFKVVKDSVLKSVLSKYTVYSKIIHSAPVVICVFLDNNNSYNRVKDIQGIGACIQNMLLEVHELGLGACWLGEILNRRKKAEKLLGVPSSFELMAAIPIGHPLQIKKTGIRKLLKQLMVD